LNAIFDDILDDQGNLCVLVYDVNRAKLITGLQTEAPMPIASAFKGPLFIYFMSVIDEEVWAWVPFEYWQAQHSHELPGQYRAAWITHRQILKDLYLNVVLSENEATRRVLVYIARYLNSTSPLVAFNDWSHEVVNSSPLPTKLSIVPSTKISNILHTLRYMSGSWWLWNQRQPCISKVSRNVVCGRVRAIASNLK